MGNEGELVGGQRLRHDQVGREARCRGIPPQLGVPGRGIDLDGVGTLALDRGDLVLRNLADRGLAREVGEGVGQREGVGEPRLGHVDDGGAARAKVGIRQQKIVAGLRDKVVGRHRGREIYADLVARKGRQGGRARSAHVDPVIERRIRRWRQHVVRRGEIGHLQVRRPGHLPRQVLEHVPPPGRRVVDRSGLRRADHAVHQERHDPDHQQAGDAKPDHHFNHREPERKLPAADPATAPPRIVCGRNHGTDLTTVTVWLSVFACGELGGKEYEMVKSPRSM